MSNYISQIQLLLIFLTATTLGPIQLHPSPSSTELVSPTESYRHRSQNSPFVTYVTWCPSSAQNLTEASHLKQSKSRSRATSPLSLVLQMITSSGLILFPFISALEPANSCLSFTLPCTDSLSKDGKNRHVLTLGFPTSFSRATGAARTLLVKSLKTTVLLNDLLLSNMGLHLFSLQYQFSCLPL